MDDDVVDHFNQTQDISLTIADVGSQPISRKDKNTEQDKVIVDSDKKSKRSKGSKKKVKFQKDHSDVVSGDQDTPNKGDDIQPKNGSRGFPSSESESERNRSRSSTISSCSESGSVKNGTGMLAFAVRSSKTPASLAIERTDSMNIGNCLSGESLRQSIISNVEFFTDDEDIVRSRSNTDNSNCSNASTKSDTSNTQNINNNMNGRDNVIDSTTVDSAQLKSTDKEMKQLRVQAPKTFVSQAALEAGEHLNNSLRTQSTVHLREKRYNIFDKLSRRNSKPKKRFSILSTEYTQKQPQENVQLNTANLLFGVLQRPVYHSIGSDADKDHHSIVESTRSSNGRLTVTNTNYKPQGVIQQPEPVLIDSSQNLGTNVSRYVNIFCNMSKRKKYKDTISIASSNGSGEHRRTKSLKMDTPQTVDFVKRTRRLFNDGRGKYDIAEAVIRASLTDNISGVSYIPLTMEEHGHNCQLLSSSLTLKQELNY